MKICPLEQDNNCHILEGKKRLELLQFLKGLEIPTLVQRVSLEAKRGLEALQKLCRSKFFLFLSRQLYGRLIWKKGYNCAKQLSPGISNISLLSTNFKYYSL